MRDALSNSKVYSYRTITMTIHAGLIIISVDPDRFTIRTEHDLPEGDHTFSEDLKEVTCEKCLEAYRPKAVPTCPKCNNRGFDSNRNFCCCQQGQGLLEWLRSEES